MTVNIKEMSELSCVDCLHFKQEGMLILCTRHEFTGGGSGLGKADVYGIPKPIDDLRGCYNLSPKYPIEVILLENFKELERKLLILKKQLDGYLGV